MNKNFALVSRFLISITILILAIGLIRLERRLDALEQRNPVIELDNAL